MKMHRILLIIGLLGLFISNNKAQSSLDNLEFKQFSTPEGLPNSMVHQVYQDRDGYIWIPTFYGLFRYDGYEIRTYKSNLYTPGLLVNNNVLCVEEDYSHRLWIGTHEGLCILDKQTGTMKRMKLEGINRNRLNEIHATKDNRIYLGYIRGMAYYDAQQDTLVLMTRKNCKGDVPEQVNIQTLYEDENGDLLIGTWKDGLYRYCIKKNHFIHYPPMNEENSIFALFQDSRGVIWIGTNGWGLYKANFSSDKKTVSFKAYRHNVRDASSLPSDFIYSIHEDLQTRSLWLGTRDGVGIMEFSNEGQFVNYQETSREHFLPVREVNTVFRDENGLMWVGTKGAGVFHADTRERSFKVDYPRGNGKSFSDLISTLYIEENGALWVGFGYGIDYELGDKKTTLIPSSRPYHISYSSSTREVLLAVHDEGVIACRDGKIIHQYKTANCGFVPDNLVYLVHEDRKGNWWLGTYNGLGVRYQDGREYCIGQMPGTHELLSKEITSIVEDNDGSLWLATNNNGIIHVTGDMERPESLQCKNYCMENNLLPVNTPLCFLLDKSGRIWVGTEGSGLCLYDAQNDCFKAVHKEYNLPGDMVGSIEEDNTGNLWLGTNQGLARLTIIGNEKGRVRIFTVADGLADNFFSQNASFHRDGTFYFGCSRGIISFHPEVIQEKHSDISLCITDILINGESLEQMPPKQRKEISPFTANFTSQLVIPASYSNFTICFASLTYNQPQQNKYAYRLQGFDADWHYVNAANRNAYYSNLSPGKYIFELRATNENGDWGEVRTMEILIEPPFWATWWAYVIYTLLGILIIALVLSEIRRRFMLRNRLHLQEMETNKVQELNHIKLQFFTNITHELMTPLTIISASLDELKGQSTKFNELYHTMDINVQRLIRLLQQILEFRKAESGNLKLRVAQGDMAQFIRHEAESFEPLIRKRKLHFSVLCEQDAIMAYFDRDKLDKILYNLLSNAAKYNREDGFIELSVRYSSTQGNVVISIKDNGKGISEERQKTLFQRFYEGDYRQFHTIGTGIGLSLTRDLVKLHKGTIRVESEVEKGTQFFIELPIEHNAYSDDEIIEVTEENTSKDRIIDQTDYETPDTSLNQAETDAPCILLAEDNEELLSVMYRLLNREYRVLKASNGREALDMIKNEDVNLVVSDVVMPEMSGIELTRHIKTDLEICHIPIVLLTAKSAEEDRDEGYTAGADAYLTKPFNLSTLHARIKSLLKLKERAASEFKKQLAFEIKDLSYTDMDEKFLHDAIACVNLHLSDTEFDVPQFIDEMATSRTTLHKKLKSLTGLNTTSFVRNIRLKAACKIMDDNRNIRISDLAYRVGFNDPKYFSICFKKEFGMQPTEYCERYENSSSQTS